MVAEPPSACAIADGTHIAPDESKQRPTRETGRGTAAPLTSGRFHRRRARALGTSSRRTPERDRRRPRSCFGGKATAPAELSSSMLCGGPQARPPRGSSAAPRRPTHQRTAGPRGAPGLLICQEAGVSACAPGRRPRRQQPALRSRARIQAKAAVAGCPSEESLSTSTPDAGALAARPSSRERKRSLTTPA
jgi:hypothetical protein